MEAAKAGRKEICMINVGVLHQIDQQIRNNTTLKIFIFKCGHSDTFKFEQV